MNLTDNTSPRYHVAIYRKAETITAESVLEDFMYFVTTESEYEPTNEELEHIQKLINEFIGYDIEKVKAGEKAMLEKWSHAINDTVSTR